MVFDPLNNLFFDPTSCRTQLNLLGKLIDFHVFVDISFLKICDGAYFFELYKFYLIQVAVEILDAPCAMFLFVVLGVAFGSPLLVLRPLLSRVVRHFACEHDFFGHVNPLVFAIGINLMDHVGIDLVYAEIL